MHKITFFSQKRKKREISVPNLPKIFRPVTRKTLFFLPKQNACNIHFIESFYLRYGIYKPWEVKNHLKNLVFAHSFLYQIVQPSVYKSYILNRMIDKL